MSAKCLTKTHEFSLCNVAIQFIRQYLINYVSIITLFLNNQGMVFGTVPHCQLRHISNRTRPELDQFDSGIQFYYQINGN